MSCVWMAVDEYIGIDQRLCSFTTVLVCSVKTTELILADRANVLCPLLKNPLYCALNT